MRNLIGDLALCLGFGMAGAVAGWLLGGTVLAIGGALLGLRDPIGEGLLTVYVLSPGGFGLGVLLAGYLLWQGPSDRDGRDT